MKKHLPAPMTGNNRSEHYFQGKPFPSGKYSFIVVGCLGLSLLAGCGKKTKPAKPVDVSPQVRLVKPAKHNIVRHVGEPSYVYAYEQTAIYPKITGFIKNWNVDIGDPIVKGQEIATLYVPELVAELEQKKAQVEHDKTLVEVSERIVVTAQNAITEAAARVEQSKAEVVRHQASVERWESEDKRLTSITAEGVLDKQILSESLKQLKAERAARDAAKAAVDANLASEQARRSDLEKAKADVQAAKAKAEVSRRERDRVAALNTYLHIRAPYDGIVVVRNANVGDYLQPGTGDQSVQTARPGEVNTHQPIYVVARTDKVRVYVDVPGVDANSVQPGTPVRISFPSLGDEEIAASVTRTSWALHRETRTLRAEVDLPNTDGKLLPNMYAYGRVLIEHKAVWALPKSSVIEIGNQDCCYLYENGKAVKTPVQTGPDNGKMIQVNKIRVKGGWADLTGDEEVIVGNLSELGDGEAVKVNNEPPASSDKK